MATKTVMRASPAQRDRVKLEEGWKLQAYKDTLGIWTIGAGHAETNPRPVRGLLNGEYYEGKPKAGVTITLQEAERLLTEDLDEAERGISELVNTDLTQNQFDALVDFVHQFGLEKFDNSTLLTKINFNPSSPLVLTEFMRWTRAGGEHAEYVWRRSARRCCVYTGTLIPQKLWRKASTKELPTDGYPFVLKDDGGLKIDYSITPTIEKILEEGVRLSKKPQPDLSKPWPTPDELILTTPAPPVSVPEGKGDGAEPPTQPAPAPPAPPPSQQPKPTVSGPAKVEAKPAASGSTAPQPPQTLPVPVSTKPPPEPVIIAPKSVDVRSIPYGEIDVEKGAKNMTDSQRAMGMVIVGIGSVIQVVTTRLGVGTAVGAIAFDLSRDPVVIALGATAIAVLIGWLTRKRGTKVMKDGMVNATQVLK